MAAWQRNSAPPDYLHDMRPSQRTVLETPDSLHSLLPSGLDGSKVKPAMTAVQSLDKHSVTPSRSELAEARDMAFICMRQKSGGKNGWTSHNVETCITGAEHEQSVVGLMPILNAPAHEMDTLYTAVQRCRAVASALGQQHVVITVDEALFQRLVPLKWAHSDLQEWLVVRLGGFHTALNFLGVIGRHVECSGLLEVWVESGLFGSKTAERVLSTGRPYNKAVRGHKLTRQALWDFLLPMMLQFMREKDKELQEEIETAVETGAHDHLNVLLNTPAFRELRQQFHDAEGPTRRFWMDYMKMVELLLRFLRAQRTGDWGLHLESFREMLPFFFIHGHQNYAR